MNGDERATAATGISRRSFIKAGGAVIGGAAIPGMNLETEALEGFAADGGRALGEGGAADGGLSPTPPADVRAPRPDPPAPGVEARAARALRPPGPGRLP